MHFGITSLLVLALALSLYHLSATGAYNSSGSSRKYVGHNIEAASEGLGPVALVDVFHAILSDAPNISLENSINTIVYTSSSNNIKAGCLTSVRIDNTRVELAITDINKFLIEIRRDIIAAKKPAVTFDAGISLIVSTDIDIGLGVGYSENCWKYGSENFGLTIEATGSISGDITVIPEDIEIIANDNQNYAYFRPKFLVSIDVTKLKIDAVGFRNCDMVCSLAKGTIKQKISEAKNNYIKQILPVKVSEFEDELNNRIPIMKLKLGKEKTFKVNNKDHLHFNNWKEMVDIIQIMDNYYAGNNKV